MDDLRISRRLLTGGEIKELYEKKRDGGDLLAYYPLDGDARDRSGNERHGNGVGALGATDRLGRPGAAQRGEGLGLPAVESAEMAGGFTMNLWLRPDAAGRWQTLFGEAGGALILRLTPENRLELELAGERRQTGPLAAAGWTMVTLVNRVDERAAEVYVNGRLAGRCGHAHAWTGKFSGDWPADFAGAVDDARFYRRALTVEEIKEHFQESN